MAPQTIRHAPVLAVKHHPAGYHRAVQRARRHHRFLSAAAFGLLLLAAEVGGRSATARIDRLLHVSDPISAGASYSPFLLLAVKIGVALLAARLAWRFARAHTAARAGRRLLATLGSRSAALPAAPRVRLRLSPRLWLAAFASTATIYLLQTDLEQQTVALSPWLHTYALPVFAVLAVLVAVGWSVVSRWLADYETYAEETFRHATRLVAQLAARGIARAARDSRAPRRRFGLAFESRPPPAPA
jgi:hypothetical protein